VRQNPLRGKQLQGFCVLAVHMHEETAVPHLALNRQDAMRISIAILAAVLTTVACSQQPPSRGVEPSSARYVLLLSNDVPECPYRELGTVTGRTARDIRTAAFAMRANAVLLDATPGVTRGGEPYAGTAIQFLSRDCRR
jgi:hypothetical protein